MSDTGSFIGIGVSPLIATVGLVGEKLRVVFTELMLRDSNFQNPASYVFTVLGGGSVSITTTATSSGSDSSSQYVDLTLSQALTIGTANYRLTASASLKDVAGNAIDAGGRIIDFNGSSERATFFVIPSSIDFTKIRVRYFRSVKQVNASNSNDALHVANYSITGGVQVLSIASVSSTDVELTVSGSMPGTNYTMAITGVEDTSNNEVA